MLAVHIFRDNPPPSPAWPVREFLCEYFVIFVSFSPIFKVKFGMLAFHIPVHQYIFFFMFPIFLKLNLACLLFIYLFFFVLFSPIFQS